MTMVFALERAVAIDARHDHDDRLDLWGLAHGPGSGMDTLTWRRFNNIKGKSLHETPGRPGIGFHTAQLPHEGIGKTKRARCISVSAFAWYLPFMYHHFFPITHFAWAFFLPLLGGGVMTRKKLYKTREAARGRLIQIGGGEDSDFFFIISAAHDLSRAPFQVHYGRCNCTAGGAAGPTVMALETTLLTFHNSTF